MLNQHTLDITSFSAIQTWLIDPEVRDLLLAQLIEKGQVVFALDETPIHYTDYNWAYYNEAAKPGSVAILTIKGVIYDYYADYLINKMMLIYGDKNVVGMIVKMNSPGGSGDAGYRIADSLMNAPIPTWCHIDYGQASSAGYLIACSCDGISASRLNDRVGSIGAYIQYQNWKKYYEKLGVISKDVYATQSTEKNIEGREAEKGNYAPLEAYVTQECQAFLDYVKSRRQTLDTTKKDYTKGGVFTAADGKEIGLIDEICSLKEAASHVSSKSSITTTNSTPRINMTTILGYVQMGTLSKLKGAEASAFTAETIEKINAELAAAGFNGIAMVNEAQFKAAVDAANNSASGDAAALTTAQADVTRLTTELATANTEKTTLQTQLTTAQEEVTRLGALNGDEKTNLNKGKDDVQADAGQADSFETFASSLDHYKNIPEYLKNPVAAAK